MQTVINNYIVNSTIVGSTVLQGSNDNNVAMLNMTGNEIGGFAGEVLRIFMGLDLRSKSAVLAYLYDLEDGRALPMGMEASA